MEQYYPLITMASVAVFGCVGWSMANARDRNPLAWMVVGGILPPLLLILLFLKREEDAAEKT